MWDVLWPNAIHRLSHWDSLMASGTFRAWSPLRTISRPPQSRIFPLKFELFLQFRNTLLTILMSPQREIEGKIWYTFLVLYQNARVPPLVSQADVYLRIWSLRTVFSMRNVSETHPWWFILPYKGFIFHHLAMQKKKKKKRSFSC